MRGLKSATVGLFASAALVLALPGAAQAAPVEFFYYTTAQGAQVLRSPETDQCYHLSQRLQYGSEVLNKTDSTARLFQGTGCLGEPVLIVEPGEVSTDLKLHGAQSVEFVPAT
ncbi:hypothetical protein [Streptomyces sp. NPDC053813]|uniref:hypothetical protein n=1 Tax=Streptomyces sp. NPDC053813 TaxID=3365717 RepID=UPI0037D8B3EF